MPFSHIRMPLPGPAAQALIARDTPVTTPSYPRDYPFVMAKGRGAEVWDVDGNRYLDLLSGFGVFAVGRNHPVLSEALKSVLDSETPALGEKQLSMLPAEPNQFRLFRNCEGAPIRSTVGDRHTDPAVEHLPFLLPHRRSIRALKGA